MNVKSIEKAEIFYMTVEKFDPYSSTYHTIKYRRVPGKTMNEDLWYMQVGDGEYHIKSLKQKEKLKQAFIDHAERTFNGCS